MVESIINNCLGILKTFKSSDVWNTLQDYWKMYQKKQYNKWKDIQDDEEGGHDKECNESDGEDMRIEVEDNVECDGIDDTFSDNEDEPQRNRQRWTLQGEILRMTSEIVVRYV